MNEFMKIIVGIGLFILCLLNLIEFVRERVFDDSMMIRSMILTVLIVIYILVKEEG